MKESLKTWTAKWINPEPVIPAADGERPASYLRKTFFIDEAQLREPVLLYATAHGIYNFYINGIHVDGFVMAPGTSEYVQILPYQKYDITQLLREGENEILAVLGNGWWRGTITYDGIRNGWGDDVALLAEIVYKNRTLLITDESWMAAQDGPIRDTDNMQGEVFDARMVPEKWHPVTMSDITYDNLRYVDCPAPLEHEEFSPRLMITPEGDKILDFGQNIAGYVSFEIDAREGQQLILIHGETLDGAGNFCMDNFQSFSYYAKQQITYTCKEGKNSYKPTNTFMGFQYVKVLGDIDPDPSCFKAHAVYSDLKPTGDFSCGAPLVNKLFRNALWSLKGNLLDLPTDCPTREKSGFTGDLVTYIHTFMYLMDCYPMIRKFVDNQSASQRSCGRTRQIICDPRQNDKMEGSAGWCDSIAILPYKLGLRYNDFSVFEDNYDHIKVWADYCIREAAKGTRPEHMSNPYRDYLEDQRLHWGEWAEPGMDIMTYTEKEVYNGQPEVGTAYLSYTCSIIADYALRTGRKEDADYYGHVSDMAKKAYYWQFTDHGRITSDRMCCYIRPIALNILNEKDKKQAAADLNELVKKKNFTLNTGFLTTHELCRTLSEYGYIETAYNLLLNEKQPGWLFSVKNGATTIPETWDAYQPDGSRWASFNHYSYGSIVGWLMDSVLGIRVSEGKISIAPKPDQRLGHAEGYYDSPAGRIESRWAYDNSRISYEVTVPDGVCAEFVYPDGRKILLESGTAVL